MKPILDPNLENVKNVLSKQTHAQKSWNWRVAEYAAPKCVSRHSGHTTLKHAALVYYSEQGTWNSRCREAFFELPFSALRGSSTRNFIPINPLPRVSSTMEDCLLSQEKRPEADTTPRLILPIPSKGPFTFPKSHSPLRVLLPLPLFLSNPQFEVTLGSGFFPGFLPCITRDTY